MILAPLIVISKFDRFHEAMPTAMMRTTMNRSCSERVFVRKEGRKGRLLGSNVQGVLMFLVGLSMDNKENIRWVAMTCFSSIAQFLQ